MAFPSGVMEIVIQYCPPHIPFRAASVEVLKVTEHLEPFMEYFGDQLMKKQRYQGPISAPHQLSRAVRIGHSVLVKLLMRFSTDPHVPITFYHADEDDGEVVVEETPFETAIRTRNWDAVVTFIAHGHSPCFKSSRVSPSARWLLLTMKSLPWKTFSKEARGFLQQLKEEYRMRHQREKEEARRAKEDYQREKEDTRRAMEDTRRALQDNRRAKEDARHARYDLRRTHTLAKRQQCEVGVAEKELVEEEAEQERQEDIIDSDISHNGEAPVSSDEAFARTVEQHILADQWGIPAAQLSADWAQPIHDEVMESTGIQMREMQTSLEAGIIEDPAESIHCLEFSRTPKSFHEALDTSAILMDCHNDMRSAGLDCKLESGTRLYLLPEQHAETLRAVVDLNLQSRHVVASIRFVDAITQAIAAISGREQVREKTRQCMHLEQEISNAAKKESALEAEIPMLIKKLLH